MPYAYGSTPQSKSPPSNKGTVDPGFQRALAEKAYQQQNPVYGGQDTSTVPSIWDKTVDATKNIKNIGSAAWDYISGGGMLGMLAKQFNFSGISDASKALQNKAIAYDLQNKLKNQYEKDLATGGVAPGAAQTQLSKDLNLALAGQFSQQQYQDRYAPQMNQQNINTGGGGGNSLMNTLAPYAPYIVSGTAPPTSSPAASWYSNLGNPGFGNMNTNISSEYTKAQTAIANTLTNKGPLGQIAVTQSPFYDFLKKNNLDRGILQ